MVIRMIEKLKAFLRTNIYTKNLYNILRFIKRGVENRRKRYVLQHNGEQTIKELQNILEKANIVFFFDMGTLLGIVREGRLLGHDLDIDIAISDNNKETINLVRSTLLNSGCRQKFLYIVDGIGIVEESYVINNIKFDINYYKTDQNHSKCYLLYTSHGKKYKDELKLSVVELSCSPIADIEKISFADTKINIPQNAEHYLAERYGENWRIPDKNYIYYKGPSAKAIKNIGMKITIK